MATADKSTFAQPLSATSGLAGYALEGAKHPRRKRRSSKPGAASGADEEKPMDKLNLFVPITKVDVAQRLVYGVATAERPDISKEVCDYATTKPLYQKWSDEFAKATDGKSLGNVRAMHGKVAAGKVTSINFNDDERQIEICAKVVDDAEWQKVEEGVYTGFSQGGRYVKRWKDGEFMKYTAEPLEVSLVDKPCLSTATFSLVKADGSTEVRNFKTVEADQKTEISNADLAARATELAKAAGKPDAWAEFIGQARTELEAAAVAKAAPAANAPAADDAGASDEASWAQVWVHPSLPGQSFKKKAELREALNKAAADAAVKAAAAPVLDKLNAIDAALAKHDGGPAPAQDAAKAVELPKIETVAELKDAVAGYAKAANKLSLKRHLMKRAAVLKATVELPAEWLLKVENTAELQKGITLYSVAGLLQLLGSIESYEEAAEYVDPYLGSVNVSKELRDRFGAAVVELGDICASMLDLIIAGMRSEEAQEAMERCAPVIDLMKAGARHSKADMELLNKIHDHAVDLGAKCGDSGDDTEKLAKAATDLQKITAERDTLAKAMEAIGPKLDETLERIKKIESQPMPGGPARTNVVLKQQDGLQVGGNSDSLMAAFEKLSADDQTLTLIKLAQTRGITAGR